MEELPKHKFTINLLKLSSSDDFETALTEWELVFKDCKKDKQMQCICQHVIKYGYFFLQQANQIYNLCRINM